MNWLERWLLGKFEPLFADIDERIARLEEQLGRARQPSGRNGTR